VAHLIKNTYEECDTTIDYDALIDMVKTYFRPEVAKVMLSSDDMIKSKVLDKVKLTEVQKD
jgi:hypothetical protein